MEYYDYPSPTLVDISPFHMMLEAEDLLADLRSVQSVHDDFEDKRRLKLIFARTFSTLKGLSQKLPRIQRKLKRLWSNSAKLKDRLARCRNRHFSKQWWFLKEYLYLVLDMKPFHTVLEPGGGLEQTLHQAEQLLAASCVWPSRGVEPNDLTIHSEHWPWDDSFVPEYQQAVNLLQQLYDYENTLSYYSWTVKSQLRQLRSVEETLDEEDRQKRLEQRQHEISMERLARFIRQVAIRLQVNLEFLLLLCKSSKFPDGDEPACTTMPWNILPALIVLWGVCWMFYGSSGFSDPTVVHYACGTGNDEVPGIDWSQWTNNEPFWEPAAGISLAGLDMFAGQLAFPDANSGEPHFTAFPEHQTADAGNSAHVGHQHVQEAEGVPIDVSDYPVPSPTRGPSQPISHYTSPPILEQTLPSKETSAQSASHSLDNSIICPHPECNGLQFNKASEWKKHNERKHDRRKCLVRGCGQSFGSKGELDRHGQTKHNQLPSDKRFCCPFTGCRYSLIPHFKRKDHLTNHLKCMHACSLADAKARADVQARDRSRSAIDLSAEPQPSSAVQLQLVTAAITTATDASSDSSLDQSDSATSNSHKRRRLGERALSTAVTSIAAQIAASHDGLETWKRKAAEREEEVEVVKAQNAALRTENESLKSEIERLKRCEESLIAAVLAAARRP